MTFQTHIRTRIRTVQAGIFDSMQFLLFCYYGGMILTALKRLDRAVYWFEMVRTRTLTRTPYP